MHDQTMLSSLRRRSLVLLPVLGITVLALCWCGCESKAEKESRLRLEQLAKTAAEKRAKKIDDLKTAAIAAQKSLAFEVAESNILAALVLAPTNEHIKKLQVSIHQSYGAAKTTPVKNDVESKLEQLKALDPGQGFGKEVDATASAADAARAEFDATKFDDVLPKYQALVVECDRLLALEVERAKARVRCEETVTATLSAQNNAAMTDAPLLWSTASQLAEDAAAMFERAEFPDAENRWTLAALEFAKAEKWALGLQSVRAEKVKYDESLLANKDAPLEQFGGDTWAQTKAIAVQADLLAQAGEWEQGREAWKSAVQWLDVAVKASKLAAEEDRRRREHLKALANFNSALDKAGQNLGRAQNMVKTDREGMKLLEEAFATLDDTEASAWYKLLTAEEKAPMPVMREALKLERFHYRYPDLAAVTNAAPVSTEGLAAGYVAAMAAQQECSKNLELPIEVKSRKSGIRFRLVPPGNFTMGSGDADINAQPDETPHQVTIDAPMYVGVFEVSQAEWTRLGLKNPSCFSGNENNPVETVAWTDAESFCKRLAKIEGARDKYRLPTEEEWEYSCRAGSSTPFFFGVIKRMAGDVSWCEMNSDKSTHPVGGKRSNAWGLYDMHGNVWEWCLNAPYLYSKGLPSGGGAKDSPHKAMRGGSWNETANNVRSSNRGSAHYSDVKSYDVGLRVVRSL